MVVTDEQVREFRDKGFVVLKGFFDQGVMDKVSAFLDDLRDKPPAETPAENEEAKYYEESPTTGEKILVRVENMLGDNNPELTRLLISPEVTETLTRLFGEPPVLFKDKANYKLPGCRPDKLHQDQAAGWNAYCDLFITLGIIVDPNRKTNGALSFLKSGNYEKALKLDPRNDLIRFNMGLAYLELGDWKKGLEYYELGFKAGNRTDRQYKNLPKWDGSPGQTVILWGEQGLGDEIMFGSCLVDAIRDCKKVIWDCHPRLYDTFKRSFPEIECYGTRKNYNLEWFDKCEADAHASITTAAMFYRKKVEDFHGEAFLKANPEEVAKHRKDSKRLRVGISWQGGSKNTNADLRSIPLEKWKPILEQDCDFYSFQYTNNAAREVCELDQNLGIKLHHYPDLVENYNYDKTINFLASMDVVITVCTTLHQAAGALGLPTWTLVPYMPAWRYGLSGTTSPWYKSARMFRQNKDDTWGPVIRQVSDELKKLTNH